jgi:hypothetical protein
MSERCKGKKIAIIVAQEFEDVELLYPIVVKGKRSPSLWRRNSKT